MNLPTCHTFTNVNLKLLLKRERLQALGFDSLKIDKYQSRFDAHSEKYPAGFAIIFTISGQFWNFRANSELSNTLESLRNWLDVLTDSE